MHLDTGKKIGVVTAAIFILHLPFLHFHPVVSFDGCNYLRWFDSAHWRGGFAPLYPIIVKFVHLFSSNLVFAGQIVSVCAGSLLVIPLYYLTRKVIENEHLALTCTVFVALNPLIFRYGLVTMSDSLSLFLLVSALFYFYENKYILTGLLLGLDYLTRPETLLFAIILISALLWKKQFNSAWKLVCMLVIIMIPYIIFLKIDTGVWTISGKMINLRVWDDLNFLANETQSQTTDQNVVQSIVESYPLRLWRHFNNLFTYGGSFLTIVGIYGMIKKPRIVYSPIILILVLPLFGLIAAERLIIPCIASLSIAIFSVVQNSRKAIIIICCFILAVSYGTTAEKVIIPDEPVEPLRDVGLMMKSKTKPNERFYDRKPYIAFYAGGEYWEIPNVSLKDILLKAQMDKIKYLVVDGSIVYVFRPQLSELFSKDTIEIDNSRYVTIFKPSYLYLKIFERQEL